MTGLDQRLGEPHIERRDPAIADRPQDSVADNADLSGRSGILAGSAPRSGG